MGYICKTCGKTHDDLPMVYGAPAPVPWYTLAEDERGKRAELSSDFCIIDDKYFFILGRLEIPVLDSQEMFSWLVWVSLSEKSFVRTMELWETNGREKEPPQFGWLCTSLPCYPETLHLKTDVHMRPVGERPYIDLEPTDHPLAIEKRRGITMRRVQEIAEQVLHGNLA
jgi:hypothetical protein